MKKVLFFILIATSALAQTDYTHFVDPFIGTGGSGHTFPGPSMPFGMVQVSPDTRFAGVNGGSGYHYSDSRIYGFSHTHLSGTDHSDYCDIMLMPMLGAPRFESSEYAASFSKQNETASVGYYSVVLDPSKIKVELTATTRTAVQKYTFPKSNKACVILDLNHRDSLINGEINFTGDNEITGMRLSHSWADKQYVYFVIQFSKRFNKSGIMKGKTLTNDAKTAQGSSLKAYVSFETNEGEVIYARVGISAVSIDGARKNLDKEQTKWGFEKTVADNKAAWNKELSKIEIESRDSSVLRNFYTAMYHAMLAPNIYQDVDGKYRGRDLQIHEAKDFTYYTLFPLWDTYRALHPLLTLIDPKRTADFIRTFESQYVQGGAMPLSEVSGNETNTLSGYHAVSVVADAYAKGVEGFDKSQMMEAMLKIAGEGRADMRAYINQGYVSHHSVPASASRTLDYAYDDWCIAQYARVLDKNSQYASFIKRANNYSNLFDVKTNFILPSVNNSFVNITPSEVSDDYTAGNCWQSTFDVPHDLNGLMSLMGGEDNMVGKLDAFFTAQVQQSDKDHPASRTSIGQFDLGVVPCHHVPYIYDYVGKPWKTQEVVRHICSELYHDRPDGLSGNEGYGQMSAWYIFSSLGFYPVCPGRNQYALGSPIVDRATIHLDNGRIFTIATENNDPMSFYIESAWLSGVDDTKSFITFDEISTGGQLKLLMSPSPNMDRGTKDAQMPKSRIER
jgi:predicted alpha-1,2-mannosidase